MTRLVKFDGQGDSGSKYPAIFLPNGFNSADERRGVARARLYIAQVQITSPAETGTVADDESLSSTLHTPRLSIATPSHTH